MIFSILFFTILCFSIVLHECAHGWAANKLGDPTAKLRGRLTLNPLKHVDIVGTVIVPMSLFLLHAFGFSKSLFILGWAKPVPVNFRRLNNPKRDMVLVALAGPAVNILLAFLFSLVLKLNVSDVFQKALEYAVIINLILAIFNMIPVPPLDGSRVVMGIMPEQLSRWYAYLEPFGIIIVFILFFHFGLIKYVWQAVSLIALIFGFNPGVI